MGMLAAGKPAAAPEDAIAPLTLDHDSALALWTGFSVGVALFIVYGYRIRLAFELDQELRNTVLNCVKHCAPLCAGQRHIE